MSIFAVLGVLSFDTQAKRDTVYTRIQTFLSAKPVWDRTTLAKTLSYKTNQPSIQIEIRFNQRPNMQGLFDLAKTELNKLTGVTATFSKHVCFHSDNPVKPCIIEELASITR